ncbi:MAG: hypothetical protein JWO03_3761 [Bacteroidetes bacterium]|nr:hypothetical protein [Bacteroidota bacterium]
MKKYFVLAACICCLSMVKAQTTSIIKFDEVQRILSSKNDTTYVLNFWATWCMPCVKEYPAFQTLATRHKNEKVKVIMLSMDFASEYEKTLVPYIKAHPIDGRVCLLDELDYNAWINKIDAKWDGAIPVTLIINGNRHIRSFFGHDFTTESLEQTFTQTIKQ